MLIGEFERIWFFSYHPAMPCVAHKIERDEDYIGKLSKLLDEFVDELDAKEKKLRALGNFGPLTTEPATF
jgi:CRISPR/Cas system CSM-associated protein Csm2 small subunit